MGQGRRHRLRVLLRARGRRAAGVQGRAGGGQLSAPYTKTDMPLDVRDRGRLAELGNMRRTRALAWSPQAESLQPCDGGGAFGVSARPGDSIVRRFSAS